MKRFFVFAWFDDHARGGWNDLVSDHASLEEAQTAAEDRLRRGMNAQIVDQETEEAVHGELVQTQPYVWRWR